MSAERIQRKILTQFNDEQVHNNQDQCTTTQFKQSNNYNVFSQNIAFTEKYCKSKPIITQRSLLSLTPQISQRRGSQTLADLTIINQADILVQNHYEKQFLYIIYWYDSNIDHKYEIPIKTSNIQITIGDLIQLAITQFNEQNEYLESPISSEVNNQYLFQLYIPKKKKGIPNEDFPSFANSTLLSQTNQTEFSLKVSPKQSKYSTSLSNSKYSSTIKKNEKQGPGSKNSSTKKNLFKKLFFFCNQAEDY
ncbi:unnamed protein product [Paramecium sonneborni]|uniref:Uncharacterized protein n=1 Tax=Paramecium sonneborni TaxID=65129 RepID=A0A8S1MEB7_9CILI|nr:unnamed protein product [Paramecium sonneborni]CAD8076954.1 unnamed protein product [Paramecium sonneborni]